MESIKLVLQCVTDSVIVVALVLYSVASYDVANAKCLEILPNLMKICKQTWVQRNSLQFV